MCTQENLKKRISELALKARKEIIEHNIIVERVETIKQLEEIIKFFDGTLYLGDKYSEPQIKKTGASCFAIYTNKKRPTNIIQYLGKAILTLNSLKIGDIINADGIKQIDLEALFFAREFLIPKELFEKVTMNHSYSGKVDVIEVAKELDVDYIDVIARGIELNWKLA